MWLESFSPSLQVQSSQVLSGQDKSLAEASQKNIDKTSLYDGFIFSRYQKAHVNCWQNQ